MFGEVHQARLPAVGIRGVEPVRVSHVVAQLADGRRVEIQRVSSRGSAFGERGEVVDARQGLGDGAIAIERIATPGRVEVAPFCQLAAGAPQPIHRSVGPIAAVARPDAAPERTPHAFGRILELSAQPAVEGFVEQRFGLRLGENREQRIDAGFDRPLAKEIGAKAVNRADVCFFQTLNRVADVLARRGLRRALPQLLELLPQPQLQLARGLLSERDGDDLIDSCATR